MNIRQVKLHSLRLLLVVFVFLAFNSAQAESDSVHYEFSESSRSIMRAGPDQTLSMLVQQIYPDYKDIWPRLEQEIRKRNPQAFNLYTGKVIPGQRMKLVTIKVIRKSQVLNTHVVGTVGTIKGYATATDKSGTDRQLNLDSELYEGDRLSTDKNATLAIKMIDGAEIFLKQDSSVRLTEYLMKSGFESGSRSILDLIRGGLRTITGAIGGNPLSVYRFHTGVVTIGVRGTDYVVKLCEENNCERAAGRNDAGTRLHVVVLDGLISLQDEEGSVGELIMGQYAVATEDTKMIVGDASPVSGLLNNEELAGFGKASKIYEKEEKSKNRSVWPWIIGGALIGIPL